MFVSPTHTAFGDRGGRKTAPDTNGAEDDASEFTLKRKRKNLRTVKAKHVNTSHAERLYNSPPPTAKTKQMNF